ncbi:DUF982 domain-containing protein [Ensifer sp. NM-2]|nr:DUF982 domain-containing protein [Ensifer sp. NM-2]
MCSKEKCCCGVGTSWPLRRWVAIILFPALPRIERSERQMIYTELIWSTPLHINLPNGKEHTVSSVNEAFALVQDGWPRIDGEQYRQCYITCRAALNGRAPAAVAREHFISACLEAGAKLAALSPVPPQVTDGWLFPHSINDQG